MTPVTVTLRDDLLAFAQRAVADGQFATIDELVAYAIGLARTEAVLGRYRESNEVSFDPPPVPVPTPAPILPPPAAPLPTYAPVDLTRQGFDSPAFMADLIGRIEKKTEDDKQLQKAMQQKPKAG